MSTWIEVMVSGGAIRIELDEDNSWRLRPPFHPDARRYVPEVHGTWSETYIHELYLYGSDGKTPYFLLRGFENREGPAFHGLQGNRWALATRWQRVAKPMNGNTGCWFGVAVKGAVGAAVGAEYLPAAVASFDNPARGFVFNMLSGRIGAVLGASGGAALVLVTGFPRGEDFHRYVTTGTDWTLSVGTKADSFAKLAILGPLISRLATLDDLVRLVHDSQHAKELVTAGKGMVQACGYDWEQKSVAVIDAPWLGVGLEGGVYWYAGACYVLKQW